MASEADALIGASSDNTPNKLRAVATAILAEPQFANSPVLGHLLRYLVDQTISGNAANLKSYTIATDCLGRARNDSSDDDAYARVLVGRLRKALREHHGRHGKSRASLRIAPGSYMVELIEGRAAKQTGAADDPAPSTAEVPVPDSWRSPRVRWRSVIAISLLVGVIVILAGLTFARQEQADWAMGDFPTVALESAMDGIAPSEARDLRIHLADRLAQAPALRLVETDKGVDFRIIALKAGNEAGTGGLLIKIIRTTDKRVIFSRVYSFEDRLLPATVDTILNDVAGPTGAIHTYNRRNQKQAGSPYKCWLAFTGHLTTVRTVAASELHECASKWFAANPNHPMAVSIHAWTQVDIANRDRSDADRLALLRSTELQLSDALLLNPDVGALHMANLRIKAALRDRNGVMRSAEKLRLLSRQNSAFRVYAAMFLAFWRHPQAKRLLNEAEAATYSSPYVSVGRFTLAVAADDPIAAGNEISGVRAVQASQPAMLIVEAAYLSRIGKTRRARSLIIAFCRRGLVVGITPNKVMQRLPVDDTIRHRLMSWLEPTTRRDPRLMQCDW